MANNYGVPYMECSAKSGESVSEAFLQLARMMKEKIIDKATKESLSLNDSTVSPHFLKGRCCRSE
jgi:hypothetical protein